MQNKQQKQLNAVLEQIHHLTTNSDTAVKEYVKAMIVTANAEHPRCKPSYFDERKYREDILFDIHSGNWYARVELLKIKGEI